MIPLFRVIKPGVYDPQAFQLGQEIMGNEEQKNALEIFLGGLTLEVLTNH